MNVNKLYRWNTIYSIEETACDLQDCYFDILIHNGYHHESDLDEVYIKKCMEKWLHWIYLKLFFTRIKKTCMDLKKEVLLPSSRKSGKYVLRDFLGREPNLMGFIKRAKFVLTI